VLTASIIRAMMMEAVSASKMSVIFYQTTRRNIPEDSHLRKTLPGIETLTVKSMTKHFTQ
jgi:hypothetical protein